MTGSARTRPTRSPTTSHRQHDVQHQPAAAGFRVQRRPAFPRSQQLAEHNGLITPGIPGYYDSLGNSPPGARQLHSQLLRLLQRLRQRGLRPQRRQFLRPDRQRIETDGNGMAPIGLQFQHAGQFYTSPAPNPYTSTLTVTNPAGSSPTGTVTFQKAQSFQIISSGLDGLYGVGGQFVPPTTTTSSAVNTLPFDSARHLSRARSEPRLPTRRSASASETTSRISNREHCSSNVRVSVECSCKDVCRMATSQGEAS